MGYESSIIPRYKQRVKEVDTALMKVFLYGASTRLTGEALKPVLGEGVSAQTISNIARSLDVELERYHKRKIEDRYLWLFLDGIVLKKREIWVKLRTTNVIERVFREVRRRTSPMSCFNHDQSIERIVYAVLNHLNEQWGKKPLKEFTHKS